MRARALVVLASTALVAAGLPVLATAPATALQAPVAFTATPLDTYQTDGVVWAAASSQGKVFVGGSFDHLRAPGTAPGDASEVTRSNFAVLDAATGAPVSCAPAVLLGATSTSEVGVRSLTVSPDGATLYIGGYFSTVGGASRANIAALDVASCTVVNSFTPGASGMVKAIAATSTTVYYGGQFTSVGVGTARAHAAAAVAVGQAGAGSVTAWAPATSSVDDPARNVADVLAIAVKPGGSEVVIGGDFELVNGVWSHAIAAVDPTTGANVWTLGKGQAPWLYPAGDVNGYFSSVKTIVADSSGFYTGNEGSGQYQFDGRTSWGWDHVLKWKDGCFGATQALLVHNSAMYSAVHAHDCSPIGAYPDGARHHLLAETLTADPATAVGSTPAYPALLPFFPNTNDGCDFKRPDNTCYSPLLPRQGSVEGIGPRALTLASSGGQDYLYVVGEFTSVTGVTGDQVGITRFGTSTNYQPSLPTLSVSSTTPGQARVAWLPSLDNDDATLTYTLERSDTGSAPWTQLQQSQQTAWFWQRPQMFYVDTGRTLGTTYWYRVTVSDGSVSRTTSSKSVTVTNVGEDLGGGSYGPSPYEKSVLADNPELYLRYNETGDVFLSDRSANRDNLLFQGGGSFGAGLLASDSSRSLTVSGGAGQVLYSQKRMDAPANFSLETWFSTTTTTGGKLIGFGNKQNYSSNLFDKMVWMTNDGRLAFGVCSPSGASCTKNTILSPVVAPAYNNGARHHVVATQSASAGMALYVDGALVASNAAVKTNQAGKGFWHVGGDNLVSWANASTSYAFAGTIDETAVYLSALSAGRVASHFNAADVTGATVAALSPQQPTVSIGSPSDGANVKGVVPVSVFGATTSTTTSHPHSLQLIVDGTPAPAYTFACGDTGYSCSTTFNWDASGLLGNHTLSAKIVSVGPSDNATASSVAVNVTAPQRAVAPAVSISSPAASAVLGQGAVDVLASASTTSGSLSYPASLDLIVDNPAGAPVASSPCSGTTHDCTEVLTWDTTGLYGVHQIYVRVNATSECGSGGPLCSTTTLARTVSVTAPTATVVSPLTTVRGRTVVTVKGRVTVPISGVGASGVRVVIKGAPARGSVVSRAVTTSATGYFSTKFTVAANTVFTATTAAQSWYLASSRSARQYVRGVPVCKASAATVKAGKRDVLTCTLAGLPAATAVSVQYLVRGKWRTLLKAKSRAGVVSASLLLKSRGYWYLRTVIASNRIYTTSVGATVRIRVK